MSDSHFSSVTAAILAGGLGTRLKSVVSDRPKVLAEVNGRPFITYLLDQLADAGLQKVVILTCYMAELVEDTVSDSYRGMKISYSAEKEPLGTGGALRLASAVLEQDNILLMNGDSCCMADLALFMKQHISRKSAISLVLSQVPDISRYGAVTIAEDNAITSFAEKGGKSGSGLINAGIYLMSRSVIENIEPETFVSLENDIFPAFIGKGLYGFPHSGKFIDIGIPSDYQAASLFFK